MPINSQLKDKAKKAPAKPGVYFWLDEKGAVLYVGRATNLKARLGQYFQGRLDPRVKEMTALAKDIKYETTDNLLEAVVLEAKNIKKYWPKYNIKDRDDRSFLYVVIGGGDYPKPIIVRGRDLKKFPAAKGKVFGPYQSLHLLRTALRIIRRLFPYSTCAPLSGRACFDYQIGLCPGACIGAISPQDYKKHINNLSLLLNGEHKRLMKKLIKENPDKAWALKHLQDVALMSKEENLGEIRLNRLEGYDISHFTGKESYGAMVVFQNGQARPSEYRLFKIRTAPAGDDERALREVLGRRLRHPEWPPPDLIMIDGGSPQISFLSRFFAAENINLPLIGISKFGGDKLVFAPKTGKNLRELAQNIKPTLLKVREEAHRFANYGRKRGRQA